MERKDGVDCHTIASHRTCIRRGCATPVNKKTAKYCSVQCCALDPERNERLRVQARRMGRRNIVSINRQLHLDPWLTTANPEAQLEDLSNGREDVPRGMSRLTG